MASEETVVDDRRHSDSSCLAELIRERRNRPLVPVIADKK